MNIYKTLETQCPKCKSDLSWDSCGWDRKDRLEITGWCHECKNHVYIKVTKKERDKNEST